MRLSAALLALFICTAAPPVSGAEFFVIHGSAIGDAGVGDPCRSVMWRAGAILHNRGQAPAEVRLTGASDGAFGDVIVAKISAGESRTTASLNVDGDPTPPLWVTRLEVGDGIQIEGRLHLYNVDCTLGPPASVPFAKVAMPVYERLTPAGHVQEHFGADLGGARARLNVGVYNGGPASANVSITVRRPLCPTAHDVVRNALLPSNQIAQIPIGSLQPCGSGEETTPAWATIVAVTVDQPSLSFVSVLSEEASPTVAASVVR